MALNKKSIKIIFLGDDESNLVSISVYNNTKQEFILQNYEMDLFRKAFNADTPVYDYITFEYKLPYPQDEYLLSYENVGPGEHKAYWDVKNGGGGTTANHIQVLDYYIVYDWDNASRVESTLIIYHADYPEFITYDNIDLTQRQSFHFERTQILASDGTQTVFTLSGDHRAADIVKVSEDNGNTWYDPWDVRLTYGTNSPDYDDETISSDGRITVKFINPPVDQVLIKYVPKFNRYKLIHNLTNANDDINFYSRAPHYFIDYSLELIP